MDCVQLYDYNMVASNELIGKYEFGVGKTNVKPSHEEYKKYTHTHTHCILYHPIILYRR